MFVTAVCILFLLKLKWPKNKSCYCWTPITMKFIYLSRVLRLLNIKGRTQTRPLSCGFDSSVGRALHRWRREDCKNYLRNLVPRTQVPLGQHQHTELWNNQQARSQSPRVFCFQKFDTAVLSKPNFDFPSFSSAYWMPLWNVCTSTLSLDAM